MSWEERDLRSAELKGRIAFLDLMAMLLLIQPKMSLALLVPHNTTGSCSTSCPAGPSDHLAKLLCSQPMTCSNCWVGETI